MAFCDHVTAPRPVPPWLTTRGRPRATACDCSALSINDIMLDPKLPVWEHLRVWFCPADGASFTINTGKAAVADTVIIWCAICCKFLTVKVTICDFSRYWRENKTADLINSIYNDKFMCLSPKGGHAHYFPMFLLFHIWCSPVIHGWMITGRTSKAEPGCLVLEPLELVEMWKLGRDGWFS